jgi:opacity protein-like surface antigen
MLKFLLGAAAAFALLSAAPAAACDDCKSCPQHKAAAATGDSKGAVAEADKHEHKGCGCDHAANKECKCGEKCACASCPVHAKKTEKTEKKS